MQTSSVIHHEIDECHPSVMVFIQLFSTRSTRLHGPSEPRLCRRRRGGCPMCGWHRSRGGARALGPLRVVEVEAMRETAVVLLPAVRWGRRWL